MSVPEKIIKKIALMLNRLSKPVMYEKSSLPTQVKSKDTRISSTTYIDHPGNLSLGENVFIGQFNFIEASNHIRIDEGCQVTNYVTITTHSSHDSIRLYGKHYKSQQDPAGYQKGPVHIGAYSYIGPYSILSPGTQIGKGCLVQAQSVLKGNYPDFSIIGGNPARVLGSTLDRDRRFLDEFPELADFYYLKD